MSGRVKQPREADRPAREAPEAPDVERRVRLYRHQWVAIPLLLAIPLLALFGLFGEERRAVEETTGALSLKVDYPSRARYGQPTWIRVAAGIDRGAGIGRARLSVDRGYLRDFTEVTSVPEPERPFEILLNDIAPGEERLVRIDLVPQEYGASEGWLVLSAIDGGSVRVRVETFIFP